MTIKKARKCDTSLREETVNKTRSQNGPEVEIIIQQFKNAKINILVKTVVNICEEMGNFSRKIETF